MRIFYAFLIIFTSVILFMLPLTTMVYDFRTDQRDDSFSVSTNVGITTANVTSLGVLFNEDTQTIRYASNISENPVTVSYNGTTRQILVGALTANITRDLVVTYDIDALSSEGTTINGLLDKVPAIYLLIFISFPVAAVAAIFLNRA